MDLDVPVHSGTSKIERRPVFMGITARRQVQQNWFEGRAGP